MVFQYRRGIVAVCLAMFFSSLLVSSLFVSASFAEQPASTRFDWGQLRISDDTVELQVTNVPEDRILRIPRLNNPYKNVYLKSDRSRKTLDFKPEISEWQITLPPDSPDAPIVVIDTVGAPKIVDQWWTIQADSEGRFVLPAHHAAVHGEKLRFEPQPHKNTVGYWTVETDWCEWQIDVKSPGAYEVHILQGCGKGQGGSEVAISIGDQRITFLVEDTSHFQNFKDRHVGTLEMTQAGILRLKVVPIRKAKNAVMDVRQIRLVRSKS